MKKLHKPLFALLFTLLILFAALAIFRHSHKSHKIALKPTIVKKSTEIVISFAGDCTFGTVNSDNSDFRFPAVYGRSHRLDYPFELVRPWFLKDDLTVVNFECTLTDSAQTADKQWKFKGDARYASIFPAGSVEVVGLSNNHSFDYLQRGFDDTVNNFKKAHLPVFYQNKPYITTLRGVETVIIGDCTVVGENTTLIDGAPTRVLARDQAL